MRDNAPSNPRYSHQNGVSRDDFLMTNKFCFQKKRIKNRLKLKLGAGLKNLQIVAVMLTPRLIFAVVQRFLSTF